MLSVIDVICHIAHKDLPFKTMIWINSDNAVSPPSVTTMDPNTSRTPSKYNYQQKSSMSQEMSTVSMQSLPHVTIKKFVVWRLSPEYNSTDSEKSTLSQETSSVTVKSLPTSVIAQWPTISILSPEHTLLTQWPVPWDLTVTVHPPKSHHKADWHFKTICLVQHQWHKDLCILNHLWSLPHCYSQLVYYVMTNSLV